MSEIATMAQGEAGAIGPGRLVLVVGPSGAGKDTLLQLAQAACIDDHDVVFPRRVVTRESSAAEDNIAMSPDEFRRGIDHGDFAVHWDAHGHSYALPLEINDDIRAGRAVVVNVSRTVIAALRQAYANVVVVAITAPPDVLAQRLAARARHSDGNIAERLSRSVEDASAQADVTILNAGSADYHSRQLVRVIRNESWRE
ncbi:MULTISPECIES: phosphonate metabolism protein/1,5-bisphosphokinase (PRPP-forming) PhnN [Bradyrhizobium]|uniref:Ribose 1,5-bisphosphate phosphokinase PhnN n=1 Tax=Bradyrhizobium diazoefficiens (strain JCM 10833 / BCRC 13528 / IAM 13628 / NBRC 14792 / USDA 110) TaxID=224911 RepID=PHNN_BRADU|nr:phosphonate metabolism protein/1,5-bisphosphokinase (PRPP-forming) PhnN [Bradyrhizobium diazoefficiens]Q89V30.1 RecName: Full=Ribose 1,5-bisphosphate phosphokinase PhnN; AltName: Full=Ribose 1,5-bisphosphokinase [Bradyrhizobium diazoefficiens USDA 110]MBP1060046.1 ribose 1,5-bisphosphokinase [Bradyrhizobium japonicum]AND86913.1 ribose-phosphate pyrophosphokinase [Bradyrhizobium diazoefficiens USDA 110]AWO88360.1 phosphonate metabolism protein/1,5-bisphosphokinase (PRPP-forming) PhnN [Bradyrh